MSLISDTVKKKKQDAFELHREDYIQTLKKAGIKYQFKKGNSGLHRTSEYERKQIIERIEKKNEDNKEMKLCPVCKMKFNHLESHLYNAHKLLQIK
jgi:uncharacterized protein with PIN domain